MEDRARSFGGRVRLSESFEFIVLCPSLHWPGDRRFDYVREGRGGFQSAPTCEPVAAPHRITSATPDAALYISPSSAAPSVPNRLQLSARSSAFRRHNARLRAGLDTPHSCSSGGRDIRSTRLLVFPLHPEWKRHNPRDLGCRALRHRREQCERRPLSA